MTTLSRSAVLSHPAPAVYALVNDIESYPQYMDGCSAAKVLRRDEHMVEARLELSRAGFSQSLTTRNRLYPPERIELELVEGPFRRFSGRWRFEPLGEDACRVTLEIHFELANRLLGFAAKRLFASVADNLVEAVIARAEAMYREQEQYRS